MQLVAVLCSAQTPSIVHHLPANIVFTIILLQIAVMLTFVDDKLCQPDVGVYDCDQSAVFFYSLMICAIVELISTLVGCSVLYYRQRHNLTKGLFRKLDGYWIPNPMDNLLALILLAGVFRLIKYTLVLLDWPNSWAFRESFHTIIIELTLFPQVLFTMGITTSLPSALIRESTAQSLPTIRWNRGRKSQDDSLRLRIEDSCTSPRFSPANFKIYVPSTRILFWTGICFSVYMFVANTSLALWIGIDKDQGNTGSPTISNTFLAVSMCITMLTLLTVNSYYCYGVYRALCHHVNQPYVQEQQCDKLAVAVRLRRIFFALFTVLVLTLGYTASSIHKRTGGMMSLEWQVFVLVFYFGILYPGCQLYINYIIREHSLAQVLRQGVTSASSTVKITSNNRAVVEMADPLSYNRHPTF